MAKEGTTRYYSDLQENRVKDLIDGWKNPNSGAGSFKKGDVMQREASILIECKTPTSKKDSFSIKREWVDKNRAEARDMRMFNNAIAITFAPGEENFFLIDEKTFKFLVDKLRDEYKN